MVTRKTLVFTTSSSRAPRDSTTSRRFASAWAAWACAPPSTRAPSLSPTWPETATQSPAATAGRSGMDAVMGASGGPCGEPVTSLWQFRGTPSKQALSRCISPLLGGREPAGEQRDRQAAEGARVPAGELVPPRQPVHRRVGVQAEPPRGARGREILGREGD